MGRPEGPHPRCKAGFLPLFGGNATTPLLFACFFVFFAWSGPARAQPEVEELLGEIQGLLGLGDMASIDPVALVARELPAVQAAAAMEAQGPIRAELITRDDAVAHIRALIDAQLPVERAAAMEVGWRALGLLQPDQGLRDEVLRLYGAQVGGFYDPVRGALFLLADMHPLLQQPVIRHELTHALQDQTWSLARWLAGAELDEDQAIAMQAVLEGHASDSMNRATLQGLGLGLDRDTLAATTDPDLLEELAELFGTDPAEGAAGLGDLGNLGIDDALVSAFLPRDTPPALRAQLLFPYVVGSRFIASYRTAHPGDPACALLFSRPPHTSAEVLDPRLWESGTYAPAFDDPGAFLPGWKQTWSSRLGRLLSHVLITNQQDPFAGSPEAARWDGADRDTDVAITAKWDGDRVAVYQRAGTVPGTGAPGESIVIWVSSWGSREAAARVASAVEKRVPGALIEASGAIVRVVVAPSTSLGAAAMEALAGWK